MHRCTRNRGTGGVEHRQRNLRDMRHSLRNQRGSTKANKQGKKTQHGSHRTEPSPTQHLGNKKLMYELLRNTATKYFVCQFFPFFKKQLARLFLRQGTRVPV